MITRKLFRTFSILDSEVISQAIKIQHYLEPRKAAFRQRFGAVMTDAYFAEFDERIRIAASSPTDAAMVSHQARQTEILNAFYDRLSPLLDAIVISVLFAFPDDPVAQSGFGVKRRSRIIRSANSFFNYLSDFASFWEKHSALLIAHSCPATMGDEIAALREEFNLQQYEQGAAADNRHTAALERVSNINALWKILEEIERCANHLYSNDPATATLFRLYRGHRRGNNDTPPADAGSTAGS